MTLDQMQRIAQRYNTLIACAMLRAISKARS